MVHVIEWLLILFIISALTHYFGTLNLVASLIGCGVGVVHWALKQGRNGKTKK